MQKWKKTVVIILALGMILSIFLVGCKKEEADEPGTSDAVTAEKTEEKTEQEATAEPEDTGIKLPELVTLKWAIDESAATIKEDWLVFKGIEEALNIKIEPMTIPMADYKEKINTIIASGDLPDLFKYYLDDSKTLGMDGGLLDINDYLDSMPSYKSMMDANPGYSLKVAASDGGIYFAPQVYGFAWYPYGMIVREDKMQEAGVTAPETWEETYEVLKALKGLDEEAYPFINRWGFGGFMGKISQAWNTGKGIAYNQETGKWYIAPYTDEYKQLIEYLNKLYSEGLIDPEFATTSTAEGEEKLITGRGYMALAYLAESDAANTKAAANIEGFNCVAIPFPASPIDGEYYTYSYPRVSTSGSVIASTTEYPEAATLLIDFMYSDDGAVLFNWGEEGVTFNVNADGNREFVPDIITATKPDAAIDRRQEYGLNENRIYLIKMEDAFSEEVNVNFINAKNKYNELGVNEIFAEPSLSFSADDNDFISAWKQQFDTLTEEFELQFIKGELSMDEWSRYLTALEEMDTAEALEIYNKTQAELDK